MGNKSNRNHIFINERLVFIELLLMLKGWVSRYDLMNNFGIQEASASRDLSRYKNKTDKNMLLNHSIKRYEINYHSFEPQFEHSWESLFSRLIDENESKNMGFSNVGIEIIPDLISPKVIDVSKVSRAIQNKKIIKIEYYSTSSGHSLKEIAPHSMFNNDLKTYIRCFDTEKNRFIDLVMSRVIDILGEVGDATDAMMKTKDSYWNEYITLELVVHPKVKHKKAVEMDLGMTDGIRKVEVRKSLSQYWLRRWCVDCSSDSSMMDEAYQLALKNHFIIEGINGFFPGVSKNKP